MKRKDVKKKTSEELGKLLSDKKQSLASIRLGSSGSKSRNVREARTMRRTIARILTEIKVKAN